MFMEFLSTKYFSSGFSINHEEIINENPLLRVYPNRGLVVYFRFECVFIS